MPIDPAAAIGAQLPDRAFSWTESDVLLYHLGIGATTDLRWTMEGSQLHVLPSFGVVVPTFHETDPPPLDLPGCDLDLAQVVHGSQSVEVAGPIPTSGSATLSTTLTDIWDKGSAAVIWQEGVVRALPSEGASGAELWRVRSSIFVRGEGGFGGDRGSSEKVALPDREADATTTYAVAPHQALLYRLCGDRNPLHADPDFAQRAGFPAPILHGLCSYGIVLREVTELLYDGDPSRVRGFTARFSGVVFPGETLRINAWDEDGRVLVGATITGGDRDGSPVLADCVLTPR